MKELKQQSSQKAIGALRREPFPRNHYNFIGLFYPFKNETLHAENSRNNPLPGRNSPPQQRSRTTSRRHADRRRFSASHM